MRDATSPVQLLPGDELTLHDIHRLLPQATAILHGKLVLTRAIRFRRAAVPKPASKPHIVPFEERHA